MIIESFAPSISGAFTLVILGTAGLIAGLATLRFLLVLGSANDLFDGAKRTVAPVIDRVAVSVGSRSVSMICDLAEWTEASTSASPVRLVQSLLAQRYRSLELVVIAAEERIPTDLHLAFDLRESGTDGTTLIYRSGRDERLVCIVPMNRVGESMAHDPGAAVPRLAAAVRIASGDLICPISTAWDLRPLAVAELASPWIHAPQLSASFGIVHPGTGRNGAGRLVAVRADLLAIAGHGENPTILGGVGLLAGGQRGCIVGMLAKRDLELAGGMPGSPVDPNTWAVLGAVLAELGRDRRSQAAIKVLPAPLGRVAVSGRTWPSRRRSLIGDHFIGSRRTRLVLAAGRLVPAAFGAAVLSSLLGLVTGTVATDVVWLGASAPILLMTVVVLSLIVDDRAVQPVGRTRLRLLLLGGAVSAAISGVVGSPIRWTTGEFH
ncbi:MAG: hypothetical protein HKN03_12285 [Acidimicrobiales bacterium]|nr:hypothetical protein [Acidimicrobiales bacterium]